jgi:hypothetical protein
MSSAFLRLAMYRVRRSSMFSEKNFMGRFSLEKFARCVVGAIDAVFGLQCVWMRAADVLSRDAHGRSASGGLDARGRRWLAAWMAESDSFAVWIEARASARDRGLFGSAAERQANGVGTKCRPKRLRVHRILTR